MKQTRKNMIIGIIIFTLVMVVIGTTYAYFTASVDGNESTSTLVATGGILEIRYDNKSGTIKLDDIYPREEAWVRKNFTLNGKNTTDLQMKYTIGLKVDSSTFTSGSLSYSLISENTSNNGEIVPSKQNILIAESIDYFGTGYFLTGQNQVHTYTLEIYYKDNGQNQNANQGASFTGHIIIENMDEEVVEEPKIYGVRRDVDSSSSAWERTGDAVGLVANAQFGSEPVQNDFDNIYPWSDIISYNYKYDSTTGVVTETDYGDAAFKFDGTNGEVLTRIPEFYYNRYQQTESDGKTYEYILISPTYQEGYYKSETFSVGRYTISGAANDVHSKSGVQPLTSVAIDNFRNNIRNTVALGDDFGQMDYHYFILQLLYLVEYADYNSQAKLGQGHTTSPIYENGGRPVNSGGTNTLGMKSGTLDENNAGTSSMIYRGIEDIYGNVWQFVDGINIKDYVTYICTDQTQYAVDTFTGCYKPVGYTNLNTTTGYPSKLGYDADNPLVAMPIASGGSSSTHITDYYYLNSGNRIALVGGAWNYVSEAGLWSWTLASASSHSWYYIGARLLRTS